MSQKIKRENKKTTGDVLKFDNNQLAQALFGPQGSHLEIFERELNVVIHVRGAELTLEGSKTEIDITQKVLRQLYELIKNSRIFFSQFLS